MEHDSVALLKKYWFRELGCGPEELKSGKTHVFPHGTLRGYQGVVAFKHKGTCVVSAPTNLVQSLQTALAEMPPWIAFDPAIFEELLSERVDRIIGPAWIGQLAEVWFRPEHGTETRLLTHEDQLLICNFLASCPSGDTEVSSIEPNRSPIFGSFFDGILGAVSSYETLDGYLAHIGVLTAPRFRGRGVGKKAISFAVASALRSGLGIQYRTLLGNVSSVAAAKRLGFRDFAETIAIRLK